MSKQDHHHRRPPIMNQPTTLHLLRWISKTTKTSKQTAQYSTRRNETHQTIAQNSPTQTHQHQSAHQPTSFFKHEKKQNAPKQPTQKPSTRKLVKKRKHNCG